MVSLTKTRCTSQSEGESADVPSAGMSGSQPGSKRLPRWECLAQATFTSLFTLTSSTFLTLGHLQARLHGPRLIGKFTLHFSLFTSEAKKPSIPPVEHRKPLYTKGFWYFYLSRHPSHFSHISLPSSLPWQYDFNNQKNLHFFRGKTCRNEIIFVTLHHRKTRREKRIDIA